MDQTLINRIVEAALLAANQPLTVVQLQGLFPLDAPAPDDSLERALEALQAASAERGVELVELASGWRFQVRSDVHPWVARLWTERQTRYTRATLETLALIAYRQPITRGEIEQVRGVAVNSNIIKSLEEREWIRVVGHRDVPGRPELLGTTRTFLDYFGLKRLDELPPLSELKDFGELEPQLRFDRDGDAGTDGALAIGDMSVADDASGSDVRPADDEADDATPEAATGTAIDGAAATDSDTDTETNPSDDAIDGDDAATPTTGSEEDSPETALAEDGDSNGVRHD